MQNAPTQGTDKADVENNDASEAKNKFHIRATTTGKGKPEKAAAARVIPEKLEPDTQQPKQIDEEQAVQGPIACLLPDHLDEARKAAGKVNLSFKALNAYIDERKKAIKTEMTLLRAKNAEVVNALEIQRQALKKQRHDMEAWFDAETRIRIIAEQVSDASVQATDVLERISQAEKTEKAYNDKLRTLDSVCDDLILQITVTHEQWEKTHVSQMGILRHLASMQKELQVKKQKVGRATKEYTDQFKVAERLKAIANIGDSATGPSGTPPPEPHSNKKSSFMQSYNAAHAAAYSKCYKKIAA